MKSFKTSEFWNGFVAHNPPFGGEGEEEQRQNYPKILFGQSGTNFITVWKTKL